MVSNLRDTILESANLENSKIRYAKFYKTILVKTNLQNSDGYKTNFCGQDYYS